MGGKPIVWIREASFLKGKDGLALRYHLDFPEDWHKGKALVLVLTGRAECLDKYDRVTSRLLERSVAVLRMDWRGQGGSGRMLADPHKGHVGDFDLYLEDLCRILEKVVRPLNPGRVLFMGHSMGSHLALRHLLSGAGDVQGAILESPMFSIDTRPLPYALVKAICRVASTLGLGESYVPAGRAFRPDKAFRGNALTGDPEHFFRFQDFLIRHPALQMGDPTLGWLHAASLSMDQLWRDLSSRKLSVPILLLSGQADRVVHPIWHERALFFLERGHYCSIPDARHEIYMEREGIQRVLWAAIDQFLAQEGVLADL